MEIMLWTVAALVLLVVAAFFIGRSLPPAQVASRSATFASRRRARLVGAARDPRDEPRRAPSRARRSSTKAAAARTRSPRESWRRRARRSSPSADGG